MPKYFYTAKGIDGKTYAGDTIADNPQDLAQTLKQQGLILIKAVSSGQKEKERSKMSINLISKVSLKDKIMLTRNLWIMVSAGLPFVKCFSILETQSSKNKRLVNALTDIKEQVSRGVSISEAMRNYPDIFSELYQNMIKIGEESGTMEDILKVLTTQMEKDQELRSKVQNAMIYPSIIMITMIFIGAIIITFVLPKLTTFFESMQIDLPIYTRIFIGMGTIMSNYWYLIAAGMLLFAAGIWMGLKTASGKKIKDTLLLRIPVFSDLVKKTNSAVMIRSLSSLIEAGVPLVRSLEITSGSLGNIFFRQALIVASERVKKGERLSASLRINNDIFPFGAIEIIEVGEETGKTSLILKKLASFYEEEVIVAAEGLSAMIEPFLILFLGAVVAVFAASVIGPMYSGLGGLA